MDIDHKSEAEEREYLHQQTVKKQVIAALQEVLDSGHDLGGMGEYGRGWNDSKTQTRMIVKEMMKRWKNES